MTNPADKPIVDLIDHLSKKAAHPFTDADDRKDYIDQIAQLRASMNPVIQQHGQS